MTLRNYARLLTTLFAFAALAIAAPSAFAAWAPITNNSGLVTTTDNFDATAFDGAYYTASLIGDHLDSTLKITRAVAGGTQQTDFSATSSTVDYTDSRFVESGGVLYLVAVRSSRAFPPASPVTVVIFARSAGGTWAAIPAVDKTLASFDANATGEFEIVNDGAVSTMIFKTVSGATASLRSARFVGGAWVVDAGSVASKTSPGFSQVHFDAAMVGTQPTVAVQFADGTDWGPLSLYGATAGVWSKIGGDLSPPAGRDISRFDLAPFTDRPAVAWTGVGGDPGQFDHTLDVSYQSAAGTWLPLGGTLNAPGAKIASVSLARVKQRMFVVWDRVVENAGTGFDDATIMTAVGPGSPASVTGWQSMGSPSGPQNPPSGDPILSYSLRLLRGQNLPVIAFKFLEGSPRDEYPIEFVTGDEPGDDVQPVAEAVTTAPVPPPLGTGISNTVVELHVKFRKSKKGDKLVARFSAKTIQQLLTTVSKPKWRFVVEKNATTDVGYSAVLKKKGKYYYLTSKRSLGFKFKRSMDLRVEALDAAGVVVAAG